jgi:hypothetical protein
MQLHKLQTTVQLIAVETLSYYILQLILILSLDFSFSWYSDWLRAGDIMPRSALGPTHPPVQWVRGDLSLEVKRPGREADHSPPSSAEVECVELYFHSPIRLHGVALS